MPERASGGRRAFLFSLREDGSPTCHPMVALEKDGAPAFNTYRKSAKVRNLLRDPRAAVLLLADWQASPATAVALVGTMAETGPAALQGEASDEGLRQVPGSVRDRVRRRVEAGKRIYLRLETEG